MSADRTYTVPDPGAFKRGNLENWHANSSFWLEGGLRHQSDVAVFTANLLKDLLGKINPESVPLIMDYGCGDGWVYALTQQDKFPKTRYIGFDFNPAFVGSFRARHGDDADKRVVEHDLEHPFPEEFTEKADIGVNFFNFFEIPRIDDAFRNVVATIKPGGYLVVVTLDPVLQLLAVSGAMSEFRHNLREFERHKDNLGYDKDIDANQRQSGRIYKALTYSLATYLQRANKEGLTLCSLQEVNRSGNSIPQIYQYLVFRKTDLSERTFGAFFRTHPRQTIIPSMVLGAPLLIGAGLLAGIGYGKLGLETVQKMQDNHYAINNVLMIAIGVGHAIVVLSLLFYIKDIGLAMRGQTPHNPREPGRPFFENPVALTNLAHWLTIITLIPYVWYLGNIMAGSASFRFIIDSNKYATLLGFFIFVVIDLCIMRAKWLENRGLRAESDRLKQAHNENDIHFSRCSTGLINTPTLLITGLIWMLTHFLHSHPEVFRQVYDVQVDKLIKDNKLNWDLFLDGLETGAIVATLVCSQLVFSIIKVRYHYRAYWINRAGVREP